MVVLQNLHCLLQCLWWSCKNEVLQIITTMKHGFTKCMGVMLANPHDLYKQIGHRAIVICTCTSIVCFVRVCFQALPLPLFFGQSYSPHPQAPCIPHHLVGGVWEERKENLGTRVNLIMCQEHMQMFRLDVYTGEVLSLL